MLIAYRNIIQIAYFIQATLKLTFWVSFTLVFKSRISKSPLYYTRGYAPRGLEGHLKKWRVYFFLSILVLKRKMFIFW